MDGKPAPHGPGVRIPPPLIYFAFFAGGAVLDRIFPLPVAIGPLPRYLGGVLVVAALLIAALAFKEFAAARTTVRPDRPASALIRGGIFRLTRNPLYLSLLLFYLGVSVSLALWWTIVLASALVVILDRYVIRLEEQYLAGQFGPAYTDYRRNVRRWL